MRQTTLCGYGRASGGGLAGESALGSGWPPQAEDNAANLRSAPSFRVDRGSTEEESKAVLNEYVEQGGNFIDTADVYGGSQSEEFIGNFLTERKLRDRVVLATKFTFNSHAGNPNTGGNGRKNIYRAVIREVAKEIDRPLPQVALAWVRAQPGIPALLIGASKLEQLRGNLASLEIILTPDQEKRLC